MRVLPYIVSDNVEELHPGGYAALLLCAGLSCPAALDAGLPEEAPVSPEPEDGCNTMEELAGLMALGAGGTVTVTGDLAPNEGDDIYLTAVRPVTIDLGDYGIMIPQWASLTLDGPIRLTGRGSPSPLLRVEGSLTTRSRVELTAAGDGAVAVELLQTWSGGCAGACAIHAIGEDTLELYRVEQVSRQPLSATRCRCAFCSAH